MAKILMTLCFAVMSVVPAFAQGQVEDFTAKLFTAKGTVEVLKKGAADWVAAKAPYTLDAGDQVRTANKSKAEIYMKYGSKVRLEANTTFEISKISPEENSVAVMKGKMQAWIRKFAGRSFNVRTPAAVCAVRGTVFGVEVADTGATTWDLFSGAIQVADTRTNYAVDLNPGQRLQVTAEVPAAPPAPEAIPASVKPPSEPAKIAEEKAEVKAEKTVTDAQAREAAAKVAAAQAAEKAAAEKAAAEKAAAEQAEKDAALVKPVPVPVDEQPVFIPVIQDPVSPVNPTDTVKESGEVSGSNP